MPTGTKEYREPFVGGGGVYFGLDARTKAGLFRHEQQIKRWINDKHCGLIEVYTALRDRPDEFIAACKAIKPASDSDPMTEEGPRGGKPTNARLKAVFESMCLNEECDQALRYFFVNRTVHGSGRVNYDIPSRLYFSNPEGWNITAGTRLQEAADLIAGTEITCGDYEQVFEANGEKVWIYADPPYAVNTELTRTSQLYQHSFTRDDHYRFADVVKACKHNVAISYDDDGDGFIRSLFPEDQFWIQEGTWRYAGTTNETKEIGKELLILNYDPALRNSIYVPPECIQSLRPLTAQEEEELAEAEHDIATVVSGIVRMGLALKRIRDSGRPSERLYRAEYATFKDYCKFRWGMSEAYANRAIAAAERHQAIKTTPIGVVSENNEKLCPHKEGHLRELLRIESAEDSAEVWRDALESVGNDPAKVTAKVIREHVNEYLGVQREEVSPIEKARKVLAKLSPEELRQVFESFFPVLEVQ